MFSKYSSLSPKGQRLVRVFGVIVFVMLLITACIGLIMQQHRADLKKLDLWHGDTKVAMYTTSTCSYCQDARLYFTAQGIEFTELNMDFSTEHYEQYIELGGTGTPLIYVDKKRMDGFNSTQFNKLYSP